jgi:hypothetical protein
MRSVRDIVRATSPIACDRCRSERHVIVGDGPAVCRPCVDLLTDAAVDPMSVSERLRDWLRELHADMVTLVETEAGVPVWEWNG